MQLDTTYDPCALGVAFRQVTVGERFRFPTTQTIYWKVTARSYTDGTGRYITSAGTHVIILYPQSKRS